MQRARSREHKKRAELELTPRAVLWAKALTGSLGLKFALHLELRAKQATVGARPSHFPSRGSVASGSSVVPGVRVPCTCGGEGGRGGAGEQLGHSPSGTISQHAALQPCLKVGCENGGRWTRMKRRRRNRVKARPATGRRKGPCPGSDPGSSAVLVSKRHGEGTEAHTGTL